MFTVTTISIFWGRSKFRATPISFVGRTVQPKFRLPSRNSPFVFTWVAGTFYFQQLHVSFLLTRWIPSSFLHKFASSSADCHGSVENLPLLQFKESSFAPWCHAFFHSHHFATTNSGQLILIPLPQVDFQQDRQTPTAASCRSSTGADLGVIQLGVGSNNYYHGNLRAPPAGNKAFLRDY